MLLGNKWCGVRRHVVYTVLRKERKPVILHFIMVTSDLVIDKALGDSSTFCFFAQQEAWEPQAKPGTQCLPYRLLDSASVSCPEFSPRPWKATELFSHDPQDCLPYSKWENFLLYLLISKVFPFQPPPPLMTCLKLA